MASTNSLPPFHFREHHTIDVAAPPARVFGRSSTVSADEIALFNLFTSIRRFGQPGPESILNAPGQQPILDVAMRTGFLLLQDRPPHEVVIGAVVVAPPGATRRPQRFTGDDFKQLTRPGFAKATMNFRVEDARQRHVADRSPKRACLRPIGRALATIHAVLAHHFSRQLDPAAHLAARDQDAGGKAVSRCTRCSSRAASLAFCCRRHPPRRIPHRSVISTCSLSAGGLSGTLVVHDLDAAHDLGVAQADSLLDPATAARYRDALVALLAPRITLTLDGVPSTITWGAIDVVPDRQSLRLAFTRQTARPGHIAIHAYVFPYDPIHQTFINIYEDAALEAAGDPRRVAPGRRTTPAARRGAGRS